MSTYFLNFISYKKPIIKETFISRENWNNINFRVSCKSLFLIMLLILWLKACLNLESNIRTHFWKCIFWDVSLCYSRNHNLFYRIFEIKIGYFVIDQSNDGFDQMFINS